ncbi:hypothetical protein L0Y65_03765 [Candidatus Micrarchaeota archaeon]|nr:hypothetical protein [Candidatus Micrarchaeota archaeon]
MILRTLGGEENAAGGREHGGFRTAARRLGKILAGAALTAGLMLAGQARADSIELMAGNRSATLDLKASATLSPRLGLFFRARPTVDYAGDFHAFGVGDLSINLAGGLDVVGEVQFVGGRAVPRAGLQFFTRRGDFSLYALATTGLDSAPYGEALIAIRYTPVLHQALRLLVQLENITDVSPAGHDFSTQRMRLGLERNGWGGGAACDLTEMGNRPSRADGTLGWNIGGFVSKTF